jgi:hypothetical protein
MRPPFFQCILIDGIQSMISRRFSVKFSERPLVSVVGIDFGTNVIVTFCMCDPSQMAEPDLHGRPPLVSLTISPPRRDVSAIPKKKGQYYYREDDTQVGPYELLTLHLWWANELVSGDLIVSDNPSSSAGLPLVDLLRKAGLFRATPEERREWFLWIDPRTPFHSLNNRLTKCALARSLRDPCVFSSNQRLESLLPGTTPICTVPTRSSRTSPPRARS